MKINGLHLVLSLTLFAGFFLLCSVEEEGAPPPAGEVKEAGEKVPPPSETVPQPFQPENLAKPPPEMKVKATQEELKKSGKYVMVSYAIECDECDKYKDKDLYVDVVKGKPPMKPPREGTKPVKIETITRLKTKYSPSVEVLVPEGAGDVTLFTILDLEGDGVAGKDLVANKALEIGKVAISGFSVKLRDVDTASFPPSLPASPPSIPSPDKGAELHTPPAPAPPPPEKGEVQKGGEPAPSPAPVKPAKEEPSGEEK